MILTVRADQEDPAYRVEWRDGLNALIDFSTGYTFTLRIVAEDGTVALTKTANITGAATVPNVSVAWAVGELNITPGDYQLRLVATTGGRDRAFKPGGPDILRVVAA